MTGNTTDITLRVQGTDGIHLLGAGGMAGEAAIIDFLGGMVLEDENLRLIAATGDVGRPRTMTSFAALLRGSSVRVVHCFPVGCLLVIVVDILVAGFACIGPDVIGAVCSRGRGRRLALAGV